MEPSILASQHGEASYLCLGFIGFRVCGLWAFPKVRGTILRVSIIRISEFWGAYWDPLPCLRFIGFRVWGFGLRVVIRMKISSMSAVRMPALTGVFMLPHCLSRVCSYTFIPSSRHRSVAALVILGS